MITEYEIADHRGLHLTTAVLTLESVRLLTHSPVDEWPCLGGRFSLGGFVINTLAEVRPGIPEDLREAMDLASSNGCDYLFVYPSELPTSVLPEIGLHVVR